jgi:Hsp70 protein
MARNAPNTVCGVKKLLGRPFEHDDVQSVIKTSSVKVVSNCDYLVIHVSFDKMSLCKRLLCCVSR